MQLTKRLYLLDFGMLDYFRKYSFPILLLSLLLMLGCSSSTTGPKGPALIRGDVNLNGVANEVADAVLFTNYFIYGPDVFTLRREQQIAATDVNRDGLTLGVADLTYMFRKVHGDARPIRTLDPVEALYRVYNYGVIEVDIEIGAAALQIQGNVVPTLLADNMEMEYAFDAVKNVTRILIYNSSTIGETFSGTFINTNGSEIVSIEMATYLGATVIASEYEQPSEQYFLMQNIPDPFSDTTVIYFGISKWADVSFEITNYSGELVFESTEYYGAGVSSFTWNAIDKHGRTLPVGTYYCTMTFEGRKSTIEMQKVL